MKAAHTHRLSFIEEKILERFSSLVEKEMPEAMQITVFGSRARGDSDEHSDLDVAVILNVPHIDKSMWDILWNIKWEVLESLQAEEFPLSLSLITMNDFTLRDYGIEKTIKAEGITIWKRGN